MTVDTYKMLLENQSIIDAANKTITETQKTEKTLQEHILLTDTKIGVHNEHLKSHPDIRVALENMPAFIADPEIIGPDSVENNSSASWTISAISMVPTVQVTDFIVIDPDGNSHVLDAQLGSAVFTHTFTGDKNEKQMFTVQARGTYNYMSKVMFKEVTITIQVPPSFDTLSHNIPDIINPGSSYDILINGIVDLDDDLASIQLTASNANILFPDGNTVIQNTPLEITAAAGLSTSSLVVFTITATDSGNRTNTFTKEVNINHPPDISHVVCTVDTLINANSYSEGSIYGVTDDYSNITCVVSCANPEIIITPAAIAQGDTIRVSVGDITPNTVVPVLFTFRDEHGGISVYTHNIKVNNPPVVTDMTCSIPSYIAPNKNYNIVIQGATDPDGGTITYGIDIASLPTGVTVSKHIDIAENEIVTLSTSEETPRLLDPQHIRILAYDNRNKSTAKNFEYRINQVLTASQITSNIPQLVKPIQTIDLSISSPVQHANGTPYSYSFVAEEPAKLNIDDTAIAANVTQLLTIGSATSFTRGTSSKIILHVNDGVEIHQIEYSLLQNSLPISTDITCSLGETKNMFGGPENSIQFTLSGGSDEESDITYEINIGSLSIQGASATKSTNITAGEVITLSAPKKAEDTPMFLEIWAVDTMNEKSELKRVSTITIKPINVVEAPSIIYPAQDNVTPYYEGFTMTWSAKTIVPWLGDGTYPNNI